MAFKKIISFPIIFFLLANFTYSQRKFNKENFGNIVFNHPGKEMGFEKTRVDHIAEDKEGFIWIATLEGLFRFDGINYKPYKHLLDDTSSFESNQVKFVFCSKKGEIWVGIDGTGLYKYDKIKDKFKLYRNPTNPMSTSRMLDVGEDNDGNILVGTYGGGLCIFDPIKEKYSTLIHDDKDSTSLAFNALMIRDFTKDGKVWIAYHESYLHFIDLLDLKTKKVDRHYLNITKKSGELVPTIEMLSDSEIGICLQYEFMIYDFEKRKINYRFLNPAQVEHNENVDYRGYTFLDKNHVLFRKLLSYEILDLTNNSIKRYVNHPDDPFSPVRYTDNLCAFFRDSKDNIWTKGVYSFFEVIYPVKVEVKDVKEDPKNSNWLARNDVTQVFEDKQNRIWVGMYGAGISVFDKDMNWVKNFESGKDTINNLCNGVIYDFFIDKKNRFWIGTDGGLMLVDVKTWKILDRFFVQEHVDLELHRRVFRVASIIDGEDGHIWLGTTGGGLIDFDPETKKHIHYKAKVDGPKDILSDNRIFTIDYDKLNNLIWIGTYNGGVNAFNPITKKFTHFNFKNSNTNGISSNFVFVVYVNNITGTLWVGTNGGGVDVMDLKNIKGDLSKQKFYHFTDFNGLADNSVFAFLANKDGSMWITTQSALCHLMPPKKLGGKNDDKKFPDGKFTYYKKQDGLGFDGSSMSGMIRTMDSLIAICSDGFYFFNPKEIKQNITPPKVVLTSLKLFGKEIKLDTAITYKKQIEMEYSNNSFTFSFAALNYRFSEKNTYAYKLLNFDKDWIESGTRNSAYYTNLDPGTYKFMVKAANNDGYWNNNPTVFTIIIHPPFWKTIWFYCICIGAGIGLIYLLVRFREQKLQKEKRILEHKVDERTYELKLEKEKVEEAHHEILESITYAKRLQEAILPSPKLVKEYLSDSFILYKPKDIVAGDFYYMEATGGKLVPQNILFAAADCTGHGVPGAMVSVVCANAMNRALKEFHLTDPGIILNKVRELVIETFEKSESEVKDGMDISMCSLNLITRELLWAGANNPLWIIRNNELIEYKANKQPIGKFDAMVDFKTHVIQLQKNDFIYIFTDGFADQFGGEKGKKFKNSNFQKLLLQISKNEMNEQRKLLNEQFESWKSNFEQTDDVCVMGVMIN